MNPSQRPPVPTRCPVCAGVTEVEKVRCGSCGTAVEGRFTLGWVQQLSPEQLSFVRVFIGCRGKIKDVEAALGLSYPTVVARLDEVVEAVERENLPSAPLSLGREDQRRQVLDALAGGTIDAQEAAKRLSRI